MSDKACRGSRIKSIPFFSLISFAAAGVMGFSSVFGVAASSSLPLFAALALGFEAFFLDADSVAGALGVVSFSFVAVLGVFAGLER